MKKMKVNHFFQLYNRRLNDRFKPETILRHEAKWMKALRGAGEGDNNFTESSNNHKPMKITTDKPRSGDVSYCCAYTDWLNGKHPPSDRPKPELFGISEELAEVLRRQCRDAQHKQIDGLRPAVSFTEAEARQAAEDLRSIAVACCENGWLSSEEVLRVLAQKFDTWRKE